MVCDRSLLPLVGDPTLERRAKDDDAPVGGWDRVPDGSAKPFG